MKGTGVDLLAPQFATGHTMRGLAVSVRGECPEEALCLVSDRLSIRRVQSDRFRIR
jgi:hypothetical protein